MYTFGEFLWLFLFSFLSIAGIIILVIKIDFDACCDRKPRIDGVSQDALIASYHDIVEEPVRRRLMEALERHEKDDRPAILAMLEIILKAENSN